MNIIAWCFIIVGFGLQTMLKVDTATRNWVGYQIVTGIGFGLLVSEKRNWYCSSLAEPSLFLL